MTKELMTEDQFMDYVLSEIKKHSTKNAVIENGKNFSLKIKLPTGVLNMSLGGLWREYQLTGELHTLHDMIQSTFSVQKDLQEQNDYDLSKHKEFIFPSVRSEDYIDTLLQSHSEDFKKDYYILNDELIGNLRNVYFLWREGYSVPINSTLLTYGVGITVEEIKELAAKNLEIQGWLPHKNVGDLKSGKIYQFYDGVKLFHSQFFNKEWVEEHLGREFYFSFPTKDLAYVFVPNKNAKYKQVAIDRNFLVYNTLTDFNELSYKTSSMIFSYRSGDYNVVIK